MKKIKSVYKSGFTIIELLVVIVTIAILSTILFAGFEGSIDTASEATVKSDLSKALQDMRLFYAENTKYPTAINDCPNTDTANKICLKASGENEYTYTYDNGVSPKTFNLTIDNGEVAYGITNTSTVIEKLSAVPTSYTLTINAGTGGTVNSGGTYSSGSTQTITATASGGYTFSSWSGSTGCSGTASHIITMDANKTCTANFVAGSTYTLTTIAGAGGSVSAGGTFSSGSSQTITATPATYYSFTSWTGSTGCSGTASHMITMDTNKTCTANFDPTAIAAPSTPIVTPSTVGATTTFSWGAASCPGNTARYQYRYTISPSGYDSGLIATASTFVAFTTSTEGQTYTVATQAQCYNTVTSSSWSSAGTGSYSKVLQTFAYTGSYQDYTVPAGVTTITLSAWGAQGGGNSGGNGGYVTGVISVTPGENLRIFVGGQGLTGTCAGNACMGGGYNGGGNGGGSDISSTGYGGGGASDVRRIPYGLGERLIVAGGGGARGGGSSSGVGSGGSGGQTGSNGTSCTNCSYATYPGIPGYGANQSSGGAGGAGGWYTLNVYPGGAGVAGSAGQGGAGDMCWNAGSGGGGGGYYGGGGGGCPGQHGGGGGSSWILPSATSITYTTGSRAGNGQVILNS